MLVCKLFPPPQKKTHVYKNSNLTRPLSQLRLLTSATWRNLTKNSFSCRSICIVLNHRNYYANASQNGMANFVENKKRLPLSRANFAKTHPKKNYASWQNEGTILHGNSPHKRNEHRVEKINETKSYYDTIKWKEKPMKIEWLGFIRFHVHCLRIQRS